ncbi:hypothetical protein ES703_38359 [subsurface metagenome]
MKLSRTTLLVAIIGIFVIAAAGLFMVHSGQLDEQTQLNKQLAVKQTELRGVQLEQLSAKQTELEKQLSQATSQFEAVKAPFSELAGSTTAISTFLKVAKANGLEVTEITSPDPAEDKLGELTCWVVPLSAEVKGDMPNLVSFLLELNSSLVNGVITSVTTGENDSAKIELVVYTYRGD